MSDIKGCGVDNELGAATGDETCVVGVTEYKGVVVLGRLGSVVTTDSGWLTSVGLTGRWFTRAD